MMRSVLGVLLLASVLLVACQPTRSPARESATLSEIYERMDPDTTSARDLHELAQLLASQGAAQEAEHFFKLALEKAPDSSAILLAYGRLLRNRNRNQEALEILRKAVNGQPPLADARASLAGALLAAGDHQAALETARAVVEEDSMSIEGHMVLGQALRKAGQKGLGLSEMTLADELGRASGTLVPTYNLGLAYLEDGEVDPAIRYIGLAVVNFPDNPDLRMALARAYLVRGDSITARAQLNAALEAVPGHPEVQSMLSSLQ